MTPTGVKEEGSVWRRKEEKKPSKPDKASENPCGDCRRGKDRETLFNRGTHTDGFYDTLHRTAVLLCVLNPAPRLTSCKLSI